MIHTINFVAKTQRLDIEKFTAFAANHNGAWLEGGELVTNTWHCDDLIKDFLAAGNERLAWVKDPAGGLIQPGLLSA